MLMWKNYPRLYAFLTEILKEQGDTESAVVELSLKRRIKAVPRKKWLDVQKKLRRIVQNYEDYEILEFLKAVGQTVIIWNFKK